ncbi:MAG: deoxyribose-phosphate aldolase [Candidatus Nanohaloarchaea archaeon]|nr:deoxyribose-phosphate aldolase [Candidatus Nanohaloarchaea archaeon]
MDDDRSEQLAPLIDHTNLYPDARSDDLAELCDAAERYGFASVCVYGGDVAFAADRLGRDVAVCAVTGFSHGRCVTRVKAGEAEEAVADGADEIEVPINQGYIRDERLVEAVEDLRAVREAVPGTTLKVVCENCNLTDAEKVQAYRAAVKADADFIATSTGFGVHGARADDVELMAETLAELDAGTGIKASGGIKDAEEASRMLEASGFDPDPERFRIGALRGVAIAGGEAR